MDGSSQQGSLKFWNLRDPSPGPVLSLVGILGQLSEPWFPHLSSGGWCLQVVVRMQGDCTWQVASAALTLRKRMPEMLLTVPLVKGKGQRLEGQWPVSECGRLRTKDK